MIINDNFKSLIICVLVISFLAGPFFFLIVEATEELYTLNDSLVMDANGNWVSTGVTYNTHNQNYNCYAYAIGRVDEEKFYNLNNSVRKYNPGDIFVNKSTYLPRNNIDQIRCSVVRDLIAMGYTNIRVFYNTMPTTNENQELICFRMGNFINLDGSLSTTIDYHFMKYDYYTQSWYHKPASSAILKFVNQDAIKEDGSLNSDEEWKNEGVYENNNASANEGGAYIVYSGDIIYITYDKHQIIVSNNGTSNEEIIVQGGNDFYCCIDGVCCCGGNDCCQGKSEGEIVDICCCEIYNNDDGGNYLIDYFPGKDVIYEIIIPESGCYNISLSGGISSGFDYKIYSYNMYNGDYRILSEDNTRIDVNTNLYLTVGENVTDRYYLRVDYRKENTFDVSINASIALRHTYTHRYESISDTEHKAYCQCGEYEIQTHAIVGSVCRLCDGVHTHEFNDHCEESTSSQHKVYCWCGAYQLQDHLYTDHYEAISSVFHKAYCACGAFEFEEHVMVDGECELCGEVHVHEYTEYEYYSNTQHIEKCACGAVGTYLSAHTVRSGIGRFKECILCGGTVDTFSGPNQLESTVNMVTANGSYILPNGVIVLVDEDIEAYLNGTLVFYNRGDSSEAA